MKPVSPAAKERRRVNALLNQERRKPVSEYKRTMAQKEIQHLRSILNDKE
jgi:hypothetical protein